jgi:ribosomal protein L39E
MVQPPDAQTRCSDGPGKGQGATSADLPPSPEKSVDAAVQIRLFGKLKLAKCARAERRPGFFCVRAEERSPSPEKSVDAAVQIRLFGKLKLAKCARAERRPGFFCIRAEERLFFHCI